MNDQRFSQAPRKLRLDNAAPLGEPQPNEIDLRELWHAIWQGKWIIVLVTAMFAAGSVAYALSLPNIYQSEALLAPSDDSKGGGLAAMAGQLGGLASLAGINLGAAVGGGDQVAVALEVVKSRRFVVNFIDKHDILPELMAVEQWDPVADELLYDVNKYDVQQDEWVRDVEPPKAPAPSDWEAYEAFMKILTVSQSSDTGFVTVAVEHQSPFIARDWVMWLVEDLNSVMREQDVAEATRSIEFLRKQLNEVALAEMRTVFYQLIEEQTKTVMLAEARDEYVFSTIDPPVVAEEKAKPQRALICILGVLTGGMLSVIFVLGRYFAQGRSGRFG